MRAICRGLSPVILAVLAINVFAAASASAALPEFVGLHGEHVSFTGTGGAITIREAGGNYVCSGSSVSGEIVGAKEVANVVLKYNWCSGFCKNGVELWETKPLKGRIAYLNKATRIVGLLLEAPAEPVATCAHFGVSGAKIEGSIIGEIGPVNFPRKTPFSLVYAALGTSEHQQWRHFEGEELLHNLSIVPAGLGRREFAIGNTQTLTMSREVEIRA